MLFDKSKLALGATKFGRAYLGDTQVFGVPRFTSPIIVDADTVLVSGVDFPADTELTVCMCGGGGAGATETNANYPAGGGYRGEILSDQKVTPTNGESITVTVGVGGIGKTGGGQTGNVGTDTLFGTYLTALGGAGGVWNSSGYAGGGGDFISPCDGVTYNDGGLYLQAYGGQAGAFGNGGVGSYGEGGDGGIGAGGGSCTRTTEGQYSGAGGRGKLVISWT